LTYKDWQSLHVKKHEDILKKLDDKSIDEIIDYFMYENMKKNEPDFCLLYKENKKCHDMKKLNCYFCACPEFSLVDDVHIKSKCVVNSKFASIFEVKGEFHQDCSNCLIPHKSSYIKNKITTKLKQ